MLIGLAAMSAQGCGVKYPAARPYAGIRRPYLPPALPPPPPAATSLPPPPALAEALPAPTAPEQPSSPTTQAEQPSAPAGEPPSESLPTRDALPLTLSEVLESVDRSFPLLLAVQQEWVIAEGQRLAAEGAFDLNVRLRGSLQEGTFDGNRLDLALDRPTTYHGTSIFAGYRLGIGEFPVYYGDRLTADGGELRAGVQVPLLRDGAIDRRRATLRQAQIAQSLAEPTIQRARIDFRRAAARAYWSWVAAGEQYRVAESLLRLARDRQAGFEEQFRLGQVSEFVVVDNRRLIYEREGALLAAERRWQQTALELALFLRDAEGNPLVPPASRLPELLLRGDPVPPQPEWLASDIEMAYRLRPELNRFRLLKERTAVDLRLAENQTWPALHLQLAGAQDLGPGKKSTGIFALDRSVLEGSVLVDVPVQRREALGRIRSAQATLTQLLAQERYLRDQISVEVQDAVSALDRTYQRWLRAQQEQRVAQQVAELERERFRLGQSTLLEVNLRELAAAGAQAKLIDAAAEYARALADHRAALGLDAQPLGAEDDGLPAQRLWPADVPDPFLEPLPAAPPG
jgi:outer membrane protein TolC